MRISALETQQYESKRKKITFSPKQNTFDGPGELLNQLKSIKKILKKLAEKNMRKYWNRKTGKVISNSWAQTMAKY